MEAVCREVVDLLNSQGWETTYVSASQLLRSKYPRLYSSRHRLIRFWRPIAKVVVARNEVMRDPPDIVVTNGPIGWGIRGTRVSIHYYHGTYVEAIYALRSGMKIHSRLVVRWRDGMLLERLAGRGKVCVACSESVAREVKKYFGYTAKVIWNPIDIHHFTPGARHTGLLESLGLASD
ncbi:MAG: glycosyltransferase family 4 protein, partial [Acidobacteria bacterium]|nr:glycosyltransferase family 4 protein [Acidobacteriota bacterium]